MNDQPDKNWQKISADHNKAYKQFLQKADKNRVLSALPELHQKAFEKINCLT